MMTEVRLGQNHYIPSYESSARLLEHPLLCRVFWLQTRNSVPAGDAFPAPEMYFQQTVPLCSRHIGLVSHELPIKCGHLATEKLSGL
jgi:hypothetical protein